METVTIRVYASDLEGWKQRANLRGLNLSEWIRRQCNVFEPGEHSDRTESSASEDVRRPAEDVVAERSTGVKGRDRRTAARSEGKLTKVLDVTHKAIRKNKVEPKSCPHGVAEGWRCTLCGGKVGA